MVTTLTPPPIYFQVIDNLLLEATTGKKRKENSPIHARDAAILAVLFEARLSRIMLRDLEVDQYDLKTQTLNVDGYAPITFSRVANKALTCWLTCLGETGGFLFRHIHQANTITNQKLSTQNIHYLLKKHGLLDEQKEVVLREKKPSPLMLFAQKHSLPEAGYTPINLRHLREMYNLSHQEVADLLGVSFRAAQSWEIEDPSITGKREMSVADWSRLITLLTCSELPEFQIQQ